MASLATSSMFVMDETFFFFSPESLSGQYNPDTLMALLQTSVAQSEEASEVSVTGVLFL